MVGILERFLPSFGVDIKMLDDPQAIHEEVHKLWITLNQLLQEDHEQHGITGCSCSEGQSTGPTEIRETRSESLLRGNDGIREINPNGSADVELHQILQPIEDTSTNTDNRHETTLQGGNGVERSIDNIDW